VPGGVGWEGAKSWEELEADAFGRGLSASLLAEAFVSEGLLRLVQKLLAAGWPVFSAQDSFLYLSSLGEVILSVAGLWCTGMNSCCCFWRSFSRRCFSGHSAHSRAFFS